MSVRGMILRWGAVCALCGVLVACEVKRPDTVLSDREMEAVLYDHHIARAMGDELPYAESYKKVLYMEAVYKKHGITKADFDSSMVWFARYPDVLTKIYEKVNTRLKEKRDDLNRLAALHDNKLAVSQPGDSIDIWAWKRVYRLTGMPLNNKMLFSFPSDSNFQDRDTLRWTARFLFVEEQEQDSALLPVMAMQVLYKNDTLSRLCHIGHPGMATLELYADTLGQMKEVRGFVYVPRTDTVQTLLVDDIRLMRYHAQDTLHVAKADSAAVETPQPAPTKPKAAEKRPDVPSQPNRELRPRPSRENLKPAGDKELPQQPKR